MTDYSSLSEEELDARIAEMEAKLKAPKAQQPKQDAFESLYTPEPERGALAELGHDMGVFGKTAGLSYAETVTGMGSGLARAVGANDMADWLGKGEGGNEEWAQKLQQFKDQNPNDPIATGGGDLVGMLAPYVMQPGATAAKGAGWLAKTGVNALNGAVAGALGAADASAGMNQKDTLKNMLVGGGGGAILNMGTSPLLDGLMNVGKAGISRVFPTSKMAAANYMDEVGANANMVDDKAKQAMQSADNLGTFLTPGEVSKKKGALAFEDANASGGLGAKLDERRALLNAKAKEAQEMIGRFDPEVAKTAKGAVSSTLDKIKQNRSSIADQMYKEIGPSQLSDDAINRIQSNKFVDDQINTLKSQLLKRGKDGEYIDKSPMARHLQNEDPNTVGYYHRLQKILDEKAKEATGETQVDYRKAQQFLSGVLKSDSREYARASATYKALSDDIDAFSTVAGKTGSNVNTFTKNVFNPRLPPSDFEAIKQSVQAASPKTWDDMLATHIKQSMDDATNTGQPEYIKFYNAAMGNDAKFNTLAKAVSDKGPQAVAKLRDLKNTIEFVKSSPLKGFEQDVNAKYGVATKINSEVVKAFNSGLKKDLVKFITSNDYDERYAKWAAQKNLPEGLKTQKFMQMFIGGSSSTILEPRKENK